MTALALREDQTEWDKRQLAVLEANGIDQDVSEAELAAFLHECQRRKLDPFSRQIYLIGRKDKSKGRKVYRSQTSIDGFRLIARRAADKSGIDYSYEDTIWYDADGGRHEIWLSDQPPAGAKVVVIRNGSRFDAVARYGAYVQTDWNGNPQGLWRNMPDVLIAKCAEALALRKAFPEDLGGIYTEEEMGQADNPQRVTATAEHVHEDPPPPRQEPQPDPAMSDEHWYANPAPEAEAATGEEWVASTLKVIPEIGLDACRKLWPKVTGKFRAGEISEADSVKVLRVLEARMEALKNPQQAAAEPPCEANADGAEVIEGVVVTLDPEDPWASAINDLADDDMAGAEALLEDVTDQRGRGEITPERAALIEQAIEARFPDLGAGRQAAA